MNINVYIYGGTNMQILKMQRNGLRTQGWRTQNEIQAYMFMALPIIGFCVFTLYNLIWAISMGFCYYDGTDSGTRFVGLLNYINAFVDSRYWSSWLNTIEFCLMKLPMEIPVALGLAMLMERNIRGKSFFRAIYYLPSIISLVVTALVVTNMFEYFGFINTWLVKLGIIETPIEWFATKWKAMFLLALGSTWTSFGINVTYFVAALSNVPQELYEAARIDGATRPKLFIHITLPAIASVLRIIGLLSINGTLHVNEWIILLTGGGPASSTHSVMSYLTGNYVPGFAAAGTNIGYGCCLSTITAVIMAFIALIYMKLSEKANDMDY